LFGAIATKGKANLSKPIGAPLCEWEMLFLLHPAATREMPNCVALDGAMARFYGANRALAERPSCVLAKLW
jgi:hypothetical protein